MSAGISLAIALFGSSTPLIAQTGADIGGAIRESERIQREQESRRLQQLQQDRQSAAPPARIENPTPETQLSGSDTVCRDVGSITIEDADKLSPGTRRRLVRSEEHTSELQSLMRISYAVFCLKKKKKQN